MMGASERAVGGASEFPYGGASERKAEARNEARNDGPPAHSTQAQSIYPKGGE
jgi:hypothetical protein